MLQCPRCGRQFSNDVMVCPNDHTPLQADATIADVPLDPLLGRVFDGKYRLNERLGGGGMGTVYRATHLLIDRPVALKVLSQRFVGDQTAQQRFRREARAAGRMQHPNAVTVTDFGATEDGYLYIVMELLEGRTLRDLLEKGFKPKGLRYALLSIHYRQSLNFTLEGLRAAEQAVQRLRRRPVQPSTY